MTFRRRCIDLETILVHVTTCDHCVVELYGDNGNTGTFDYLQPSGKNSLCCILYY